MKPIDFGIAYAVSMVELALRKENNSNSSYVWNIISLCLYFWGLNVKEIDEMRNTFSEISNGKRYYDEAAGKMALINFVNENQERKLLFITHMGTVTASQVGDVTNDQLSFIKSIAATFEVNDADALYALSRGEDLAIALKYIVNTEIKNKE
jgi:hypothetical protein